jgi:hypothetical protein
MQLLVCINTNFKTVIEKKLQKLYSEFDLLGRREETSVWVEHPCGNIIPIYWHVCVRHPIYYLTQSKRGLQFHPL